LPKKLQYSYRAANPVEGGADTGENKGSLAARGIHSPTAPVTEGGDPNVGGVAEGGTTDVGGGVGAGAGAGSGQPKP